MGPRASRPLRGRCAASLPRSTCGRQPAALALRDEVTRAAYTDGATVPAGSNESAAESGYVSTRPMKSTAEACGYACHYCDGTVRPKTVDREVFKHKLGFIMLEDVVVGVCDRCGNRYYSADVLHAVQELATGVKPPERTVEVPVGKVA